MKTLGLLGCGALALSGCQMANPAFDDRVDVGDEGTSTSGDGDTSQGDGDGDTSQGDGDGDTSQGDGDGDGDGDTSGMGICGDGQVDPGEECDGNVIQNGECSESCKVLCLLPFDNCNASLEDGCETNLDLDGLNCGFCETDCFGGACDGGFCDATLVADGAVPYDVAIDDKLTVYWTDRSAGTVSIKELGGGPPEVVLQDLGQPMKIALGELAVYATDWGLGQVHAWGYGLNDDWSLPGQTNAWAIATGGGELFWSLRDQGIGYRRDELGQNQILQFVGVQGALTGLAYDPEFIAWISAANGGTVGLSVEGLEPEPLATYVGPGLNEVVTDGAYVYWTNGTYNTIEKVAVEGGEVEVIADGQSMPYGLVLHESRIYWGNYTSGEIMALQLGDVEPVTLATGQHNVRGMDFDGAHLVWARNEVGGGIWVLTL